MAGRQRASRGLELKTDCGGTCGRHASHDGVRQRGRRATLQAEVRTRRRLFDERLRRRQGDALQRRMGEIDRRRRREPSREKADRAVPRRVSRRAARSRRGTPGLATPGGLHLPAIRAGIPRQRNNPPPMPRHNRVQPNQFKHQHRHANRSRANKAREMERVAVHAGIIDKIAPCTMGMRCDRRCASSRRASGFKILPVFNYSPDSKSAQLFSVPRHFQVSLAQGAARRVSYLGRALEVINPGRSAGA